jgi:hypothetical protein
MERELERIWKEAILSQTRYSPYMYLEGPRKTMNTLGLSLGLDSNRIPPEYESNSLPLPEQLGMEYRSFVSWFLLN